ncbi:hypothetical protein HK099_000459 [Clydaea vesicula]|uniref:Amidohydrolase-related domain-containing protein n=1 Tax=Clydaea vesicula TaxID=447962 RepID=A0AAD5U814_9FUNG|nr:hypothetical protein HK099_000459 [Clydaea vesicula]
MTVYNSLGKVVDIHTHVYLPSLMDILRNRLVILPDEEQDESLTKGRPIGSEYWSTPRKLQFMDLHNIQTSVISTANPWLDFLKAEEQIEAATKLNKDLSDICLESDKRIYGFGILPLYSIKASIEEVNRIKGLFGLRGIIMGTHGAGKGLDDPNLIPLFAEIERLDLVIFLHPHYGIGNDKFGPHDFGHTLPLALGFTFETTIAVSRLILTGIFDKLPNLKFLLAHSGGTLPFLAGRLDSCVIHDPQMAGKLLEKPSFYLKKLYFDSVCYGESSLKCLLNFTSVDNVMWGTDNPFFPPLDVQNDVYEKPWLSVVENYDCMMYLDVADREKILWKNANRILNLEL